MWSYNSLSCYKCDNENSINIWTQCTQNYVVLFSIQFFLQPDAGLMRIKPQTKLPYLRQKNNPSNKYSCLTLCVTELWQNECESNFLSATFGSAQLCLKFPLVFHLTVANGKGKAVPLQAWSGAEGSRKLRFPDFMKMVPDGGKFVSLTQRPPLPPGNTPGTHFR